MGAMARDFSAAQGPRRGHVAVGGMALCSPGGAMWRWAVGVCCERWAGIALCAVHRVGAMPRTKTTKRTKTTREMAECGLWPVIFSAAQGPPAGPWAVGGMALCSHGGAMWRWAAWYTHILCHVLCVLYVLFVLFPALSIGFAHCVLPTNPIFFQNGYDTYFPENRHFSKNFLQVLEVAGKAIRYTVLKDKSPYWQ